MKAIWTVLLADFTMSLDNVLGVAGAAGDHYVLLIFGLALSIILMATAANLISGWIKKYKWIAWAGLLAILVVAVELIYTDIKILFL
jgi:predicted tellurium resistance membrane protein TerC